MQAAQLKLDLPTPRRPRKPKRGRPRTGTAGVRHAPRDVEARCPLHVTLKMRRHVYQLRSRRCFAVIRRALLAKLVAAPGRIVEFSVQHDHLHLVVEADDAVRLARLIQGLAIRVARGLNRVMDKRGAVFADRYHSRPLRTPTEVRRTLLYVLQNARKHLTQLGHKLTPVWTDDEYSSSPWFAGWATTRPPARHEARPTADARTWLLARGWRERGGGPIHLDEVPRSNPRPS
jgi:REP element-mobilizing transposase RayT